MYAKRVPDGTRRGLAVAAGVVGVGVVAALVIVPLRAADDARSDLERLDVAAVGGFARALAPASDIGAAPADLFTVRRVPDVLVEPVRARRAVESVVGLGVLYPEPACLTIRIEGRVVLRSGTGNALIPASVQKLLTAAAVVDTMAPEERLRTVVLTTAPVVDGEISGDLILVGGGDPMLGTEPYADAYSRQPQLRTPIEELAEAIAATGVDHVHGRIIVNDDRYDTARVVATWPDRYRAQFNAGPIGALTVNDGFAEWQPVRVYADDPALYAGRVLRQELASLGVTFDSSPRRGDVDPAAEMLASIDSPPIREIVQQMLRESDNNTAESLLKELGYRRTGLGTTAAGAEAVVAAAAARGLDVTDLVVADGSGLDRGNLVTCDVLAEILEADGPDSIIGSGLAIAAESGTIGHRFSGTAAAGRLHAKTGLLNNVNGLAGWIEGKDGTVVTFAQLFNGVPIDSRIGFELQVELAVQLAGVAIDLTSGDVEPTPASAVIR